MWPIFFSRGEGQRSWQSSSHFRKEDGNVPFTSAILLLRSGWVWPWSPPSLFCKEGGKVVILIPFPEGSALVIPIPYPADKWEDGHGLCPCHPPSHIQREGRKMSVVMVILIPIPEGRWEGGHDLCPSVLGKWRSAECGHGHPHPISINKVASEKLASDV